MYGVEGRRGEFGNGGCGQRGQSGRMGVYELRFAAEPGQAASAGDNRRVSSDVHFKRLTSEAAQVKNLRLLQCPMVLLTATLPPLTEVELGEAMLIPLATYVRASTVQECVRGKAEETALAVC